MDEHKIVVRRVEMAWRRWAKSKTLSFVPLDELITCILSDEVCRVQIYTDGEDEYSEEEFTHITRGLAHVATKHKFLSEIIFLGCDDKAMKCIATELPRESSLRKLKFIRKFGNKGIKHLSKALENSSITYLSLTGNFGDEGIYHLSKALENSSINNLALYGNAWGDIGVKHLCSVLDKSKIHTLYLWDGQYGDEAVQEVIAVIKNGKSNLQKLSLDGGKISQHTFCNLFKMLKDDQFLKALYFPSSSGDLQTLPNEWLEDCFSKNSTLEKINTSPSELLKPVKWYTDRNKVCNKLGVGELIRNSVPRNLHGENNITFIVNEFKKNCQPLRSMKLAVLGHGRIGKTTLLQAMHAILDPSLQQDHTQITSTVGIDQTTFKIANGEISVWDFAGQMEYTATHSFFLSMEMTSMLVCFNLGLPVEEQKKQITFWLDFLNSSFSLTPLSSSHVPKWNIILVGVREDEQSDFSLTQQSSDLISSWKCLWSQLPIVPVLFTVSSLKSKKSVQRLLTFVEQECVKILDKHASQIPGSYHKFLSKLCILAKEHPFVLWNDLFLKLKDKLKMDEFAFKTMLQYAEAIGRIVWLPNGIVFADPSSAPKIAAKFISPHNVRLRLLKSATDNVQILDEKEIGSLLWLDASDANLSHELDLIVHLKICFPLRTADSDLILYLFPSLSNEAAQFQFLLPPNDKKVEGVRLVAPHGMVFVRGFLCQFLVDIFTELNIYRGDIQTVCSNGAVIWCPGLFAGELIVMIEPFDRSLVVAMNASDPDIVQITEIFNQLIQKSFLHYTGHKKENLCPECLKMAFLEGSIKPSQIGIVWPKAHTCQQHPLVLPIPTYLQQGEKCKSHQKKFHDIFLSYRVKCEGKQSVFSTVEPESGVVEQIYKTLAVKKTKSGKPIFVFWDQKCLNDGKNWEMGFEHGIKNSQVIVLLLSNTTMEGIASNAVHHQDNVLIEYESALLLSKIFNVPVLPVFLAEIKKVKNSKKIVPFSFEHSFPDVSHKRDLSSQLFINSISKTIPDIEKEFLMSVKQTMSQIFKLQGVFMPNRTESETEMQDLIERILTLVEKSAPVLAQNHTPQLTLSASTTLKTTSKNITTFTFTPTPEIALFDDEQAAISTHTSAHFKSNTCLWCLPSYLLWLFCKK